MGSQLGQLKRVSGLVGGNYVRGRISRSWGGSWEVYMYTCITVQVARYIQTEVRG